MNPSKRILFLNLIMIMVTLAVTTIGLFELYQLQIKNFQNSSIEVVSTIQKQFLVVALTLSCLIIFFGFSLSYLFFQPLVIQLEENNSQLSGLLDSMVDGLVLSDLEGNIDSFNCTIQEMFGYTKEEIQNQPLTILFPRNNPSTLKFEEKLHSFLISAGDGQPFQMEMMAQKKEKTVFPIKLSMRWFSWAGKKMISVAFFDLSKQKKAEKELKKEKDFVYTLMEASSGLFVVMDPMGKILHFNHSCEELTGYLREEVLGKPIWDFFIPPEEVEQVQQVFRELLDKKQNSQYKNYWKTRKGESRLIAWSNSFLCDAEDVVEYVIGTGIDITAYKEAKEKIKQIHDKLETSHKELTRTQSQLVQSAKLASLGEMATGIAHELNQPLASISMNTEMMLEDFEEKSYENLPEYGDVILKQVERAGKIINHLKTFGRKSSLLERKEADLNQIIDSSFELLHEQFRIRNIKLIKDLTDDLPKIKCNIIQIEQVLTNLLINARDALEEVKDKQVTLRSFQDEEWIIVEVEDSGKGIPQEIQEQIFDPFFTTKEVGKGTGLGLSISFGIIKNHQGFITAESKRGQGTCFRIKLPFAKGLKSLEKP